MTHQELDESIQIIILYNNHTNTTYHYHQKATPLDEQRAVISYLPAQIYVCALKLKEIAIIGQRLDL